MKKYLINKLNEDKFSIIITLLDYETKISSSLKTINISSVENKKLLIDTALCSGLNKYRFIETTLDSEGSINVSNYKYVEVDNNILNKANEILKNEPVYLNSSVLTIQQIELINR